MRADSPFRSLARLPACAERAVALHDNKGAGAGQSGYTEAYLNMLYIQLEATIPVAAAAFFYCDPGLKWIL